MSQIRLFPRPGKPIGHRRDGRPIYPVIGGAADEFQVEPDDEGTESEKDDEQEPDDDEGGSGKYSPPSRAEWLRVQNALVKANASAKARREALAAKEAEMKQLLDEKAKREAEDERKSLLDGQANGNGRKAKKAGGGGGAPTQAVLPDGVLTKSQVKQLTAAAAAEAEQRTADKFRNMAVNQAARAALSTAGVQATNVARLVKLLDLDEVEIDEDGEIVGGMDEQIESLKADLPQLFRVAEPEKPKSKRAPAPRANAAGRAEAQQRPQSTAEMMAAQVLGSRT